MKYFTLVLPLLALFMPGTSFAEKIERKLASTGKCVIISGHFKSTEADSTNVAELVTDKAGTNYLYSFDGGNHFILADGNFHPFYEDGTLKAKTQITCGKTFINIIIKTGSSEGSDLTIKYEFLSADKLRMTATGELAGQSGVYKLEQ